MNPSKYIVLVFLLFACRTPTEKDIDIVGNFNVLAVKEFEQKFEQYDLTGLTKKQSCILKEGISHHLNEINNWKLEVIDSFFVRNYHFLDLGTNFSFVSNKNGNFYFLYLPKIHPYIIGDEKFYNNAHGEFVLKDSVDLLFQRINSDQFDDFLDKELFTSGSTNDQVEQVGKLLPTLFPWMLRNGISYSEFLEKLEAEPKENYDYILKKVKPIVERYAYLSSRGKDYNFYDFEPHGFILVDPYVQQASKNLKVDVIFIPKKVGYGIMFETDKRKYARCYE